VNRLRTVITGSRASRPLRFLPTATICLGVGGVLALAIAATAPAAPVTTAAGKSTVPGTSQGRPAHAGQLPILDARTRVSVHIAYVMNTHDSGRRSLRAAILAANARPRRSLTVIDFTVRGVIRLRSALPAVVRTTVIDGASAPGHAPGGPPVVEVDCAGHPGPRFGRGSNGSQLLGLAVDDASGNGVSVYSDSVTVNGDYLGLDLRGRAFGNHGNGLYLARSSSRDLIGLNKAGNVGVIANVISGNRRSGVVLDGSSDDTLVSNRIGTNRAGTAAIPNAGDGIVFTGSADGNELGGTDYVNPATGQANDPTGDKGTKTPVFVVPPLGNLISGNRRDGVLIARGSDGNLLNGNFVGTTSGGDRALGNGGDGVRIEHSNRDSLTGCKFVNNPFVYYNVISANRGNGLLVDDANDITVQGNFFGTAADNAKVLGNRGNGIEVTGRSLNAQVGGVIPLGNVSAGNYRNGIAVTGRARGFVTFNTFGGLFAFGGAAPNHGDGILITSTGGDNLVRTNVMSGNRRNGIQLAGRATGVTIDPDIAGLSTKGDSPLPNGGDGVLIDGSAHGNIVGGDLRSVIAQNTFSGNRGYGLAITGHAFDNRAFGSYLGTLVLGAKPAGNSRGGVLIGGHAYLNVIGTRNIISANTGNGVTLRPGSHANVVASNLIGLSRLRQPLLNTGRPVIDLGRHNVVRGNRYPGR
jgi:hypothetical protein